MNHLLGCLKVFTNVGVLGAVWLNPENGNANGIRLRWVGFIAVEGKAAFVWFSPSGEHKVMSREWRNESMSVVS